MPASVHEVVLAVREVLATRVEQRLRALGMARSELALHAGCSARTLAALLRRDVGVGIDSVCALSIPLGCPASFLLDDHHVGAPPASRILAAMELRNLLAINVARSRRERGFTSVSALARSATLSKSQVYEILQARRDTSIDCVALLAAALGTRACGLLSAIESSQRVFPKSCKRLRVE